MDQSFSSMSTKLKFVLGFLIVIAVFSIYSVASGLKGITKNSTTTVAQKTDDKPADGIVTVNENDTDHDGLPDSDETDYETDPYKADTDGDGYLDGEEVLTGTDPNQGDQTIEKKQIADSKNLTTAYIQNLIGGYQAGDLNAETDPEKYLLNLDIISNETIARVVSKNVYKPSNVLLTIDSSPEDIKTYLNRVTDLLNYLPPQENYLTDESTSNTTFHLIAFRFKKINHKLEELAVPSQFEDWHRSMSHTLSKTSLIYASLGNIDKDPILAMAELELFPTTYTDLIMGINNFNIILKNNGVTNYVILPNLNP